jgi:polysaccharide biosynthesis protein PelF
MNHSMSVLLITEGTYPYHEGGVSTWCDMLIRQLPDVAFTVLSLIAQPGLPPAYVPPANLVRCLPIALWGTGGATELRREVGWRKLYQLRRRAAGRSADGFFGAALDNLLSGLLYESGDLMRAGAGLVQLAKLCRSHDYDALFRRPVAWTVFQDQIARCTRTQQGVAGWPPSPLDIAEALQLLYRWLTPITLPLPPAHVIHASAAGFASLPGIVARLEQGTPFLLTEHGVYLRERLLAWTATEGSPFMRFFATRVARRLVELSYITADMIAPVSKWNTRWEQHLGADPQQIRVIPNGVDPKRFTPQPLPDPSTPTLVWVGRIDPLKDLLTLIDATALIRQVIPNVRVLLFGKAPPGNEAYDAACRARQHELNLQTTIQFKGFAASPQDAYAQGHAVVLSSVSEAMPFSVIESMSCGRPVIGTGVGGVPEVIGETGRVVNPRDPRALAAACVELLRDPQLCAALGAQARARVLERYTVEHTTQAYRSLYQQLAPANAVQLPAPSPAVAQEAPVYLPRIRQPGPGYAPGAG